MPLSRDPITGSLAVVEQGSPEHVASQEVAVAMCPIGFRPERPDFGWQMPYMRRTPVDPIPLVEALDRLVPVALKRDVSVYVSLAADPSNWTIEIDSQVSQ
jgi:hypothetical protein